MGQRWWPELADAARRATTLSHPDIDLTGLARRLVAGPPPEPGAAVAGPPAG